MSAVENESRPAPTASERLDERIEKMVAGWPPLSERQRYEIALLLKGSGDTS